jgi:hypothetical protein
MRFQRDLSGGAAALASRCGFKMVDTAWGIDKRIANPQIEGELLLQNFGEQTQWHAGGTVDRCSV